MQKPVTFTSDGHQLAGILHVPDDLKPGEQRPAFLVLHGFGTSKDGGTSITTCDMLNEWGYLALRFDFRGCGESEGPRGRVICLEEVADTSNALSYMAGRDDVDAARIGVLGHSFGAAVAVYAGGVDERFAAVISSCGWGNGEEKFKLQHLGADWDKFVKMLDDGKKHREKTGEEMIVTRWDIVPIPEHLRKHLTKAAIMEFPVETADSMMAFNAEDVVGEIAPRPLMLLHASNDSVTPTPQSIRMFERANQPTDLIFLAEIDHWPLAGDKPRAKQIIKDWLDIYLPV